jgi:glutathione S-transferase
LGHLNVIETVALANVHDTEPYWMGGEVTLVDYAFYPFFERFVSVETYRGITIPADHQRLRLWINQMNGREAVTRTARLRDYYVEYFGRVYADQ